jgi:small nuclear ribonucleoprotein (snRNP)-like protein
VLKGYDALMNLVLDEVEELLRGTYPPTFPSFRKAAAWELRC